MSADKILLYKNPKKDFHIPKKMKAVVMSRTGIENLRVEEVDVPQPDENQILVRVDAASICPSMPKLLVQGSEHTFLGGWDIEKYPIILGDEGAVTAVKIGKNLKNKYKIGEKLCIQPAVDHEPINHRERYSNPDAMKKLAVGYTLGGHFAEYLLVTEEVLDANCLLKLPSQEMGYCEISLSEPLSCVVSSQDHHVHLNIDPKTGERIPKKGLLEGGVAVIFGAGVMGRFHIELAMSYRPKKIIVFNRSVEKFKWIEKYLVGRAKEKGIEIYCEPLDLKNLKNTIFRIAGQNYADDIIDATRLPRVQKEAIKIAGKGSVFNSFAGLNANESIIDVDMRKIHYDETIITGSSGGNWVDTRRTLDLINNGDFQVGTQIKLVGDLGDAIEFLNLVKLSKISGKAIVYPHTEIGKPIELEDGWSREQEIDFLNKYLI